MEGIRQDRPNEGLILNFIKLIKRLHRQSISKKSGSHIKKSIVFKTLKN